jgi:hypothetical protein
MLPVTVERKSADGSFEGAEMAVQEGRERSNEDGGKRNPRQPPSEDASGIFRMFLEHFLGRRSRGTDSWLTCRQPEALAEAWVERRRGRASSESETNAYLGRNRESA